MSVQRAKVTVTGWSGQATAVSQAVCHNCSGMSDANRPE
jgi:hypothetical protein